MDFLATAGRETSPDWLKKHKKEHDELVVQPLGALAQYLYENLRAVKEARGYKFPVRGFGRLRRPKHKVEPGDPAYRNWVHLQASRPSKSIFDDNPGLYFYLSGEEVFAGGGLYDASSHQIRQLRGWLAEDPKELNNLFKSKRFKTLFPQGFEKKKSLKTYPRFYPQDHKRIDWLRLQAFYVTQRFTKKEFASAGFPDMVLENWLQTLRLNELFYAHLTEREWKRPANEEEVLESAPDFWDERL